MRNQAEERRMAMHDLLDCMLVTRQASPDIYRRIFLNYHWLRDWFRKWSGWRLVEGQDFYRLERVPARVVLGRGIEGLREPLDYACFCWILWFASVRAGNAQDWFALSELSLEVQEIAEGRFSLEQREHRESFVRAMRVLQNLDVLVQYAGDEEDWARAEDPGAEALYDLTASAPRLLVMVSDTAMDAVQAATPGQRNLPAIVEPVPPLQRAMRTLLLGPVLWRGDDPEAFEALLQQADQITVQFHQTLGWGLELGRDHARIWRRTTAQGASGVLLEVGVGTSPQQEETVVQIRYFLHPVLLLMKRIRDEVAAGTRTVETDGSIRTAEGDVRDHLVALAESHRSQWGQELQKLSLASLVSSVYQRMRWMGYMRGPDPAGYCHFLPTAAGAVGCYITPAAIQKESMKDQSAASMQANLFDSMDAQKEEP